MLYISIPSLSYAEFGRLEHKSSDVKLLIVNKGRAIDSEMASDRGPDSDGVGGRQTSGKLMELWTCTVSITDSAMKQL